MAEKREHIIGLLVEDQPGVMERISGLFARRGFNMDTIVVGKTSIEGSSHIVISLSADDKTIDQVEKQVNKLIDIIKVIDLSKDKSVVREHCLLKVAFTPETKDELEKVAKENGASILDTNHETLIMELAQSPDKIDEFIKVMNKYDVKQMSRSGINALQKGTNGNGTN